MYSRLTKSPLWGNCTASSNLSKTKQCLKSPKASRPNSPRANTNNCWQLLQHHHHQEEDHNLHSRGTHNVPCGGPTSSWWYRAEDTLTNDWIEEALHILKIHVFGRNHAGRNAIVKLQQQMRNLKVIVEGGIQKWASWLDDFQSHMPHICPERQGN